MYGKERGTMKRLSVLLVVCLLSTVCSAEILLNDTWADGSRVETALPNESAVMFGYSTGNGGLTMGTGSLAVTTGTASQKMWTYFAANGSPVTLGVGEKLITTIQFTPKGNLYDNNGKSFRFGVFNDPDNNQILTNSNSDGGGTGNPWANSKGYGVNFALSTGATKSTNASVGKRTAIDGTQTSLMGAAGAWTMTSGGTAIVNTLNTAYTVTLELDYAAVDQMLVKFAIADVSGILSSHTYTDTSGIYTKFDQLFFRTSNNAGTADVIDYSNFKVERVVPEPATMILLGLGGLFLRRRG
jgi:hypothetical protein